MTQQVPKFMLQSIKMVPASSVSFNPSLSVTWKGKISALRFQSKSNTNIAITVFKDTPRSSEDSQDEDSLFVGTGNVHGKVLSC